MGRGLGTTLLALALAVAARGQDASSQAPRELPKVVAIVVEGEQRYSEQQLAGGLGAVIGEPLDPQRIERGIATLWEVFHVRADVSMREVEGGVEVRLQVVELPVDLEPRFVGNVEIDTEELCEWAGIREGGELFLHQAARVRQRILDGYHREGFYFAEVEEVVRGGGEAAITLPDVIFEIREGPRVRVADVVLHGSHSMPDTGFGFWKGGLKHLAGVELAGRSLFNWTGKKFVEDVLQADLLAMRTVYRERGWLDAVVELDHLEFQEDRSRVWIHVVVDEGVRYTVTSIAVAGFERKRDPGKSGEWLETPAPLVFPEELLRGLLVLQPERFYEKVRVDEDKKKLREYYGERGYLSHPSLAGSDNWEFLEPALDFDLEHHRVAVTYRIAQGRQRFIREVLFVGGVHTLDRVLRREVTMLPGERADLKKIQKSLSSLYSTGYFTDEFRKLEHRDPTFRFLPTDDPDLLDLEYTVEEGRVVNLELQGGIRSDEGLFGLARLTMKNFDLFDLPSSFGSTIKEIANKEAFHGAGQRLDLEVSPGTEINYYQIRFLEPDLFRTHFQRYSLDLELRRQRRGFDNYTEDRDVRKILVGRRFSPEFSIFGGYTNQDLDISDVDDGFSGIIDPNVPIVPPALEEEEGESDLIGGLFDVRYRELDNAINPRQGQRVTWSNGLYGGAFGGDWEYTKSQVDCDLFVPMGDGESEVRSSWHFGLGLGVADPYGDSDLVPYSERFFLGGQSTLRGFAFRGVGPNAATGPLGGETMANATAEYRIPLYKILQPGTFKEIEVFGMVFFVDAGVLDPDPFELRLDELRASTGVGFGLTYPIPLSFNFGWPIEEGDGDDTQVFSFRIDFY